jgi:hypothetical protein
MAGGYPGPGEQQVPYPEYRAWHPQGAPGGYLGPVGYGEAVDRGDYAYVIHDADAMAPAPTQPRTGERGPGLGAWSPANAGYPAASGQADPGKSPDATAAPTVGVRAITAGAAGTGRQAAKVSPAEAVNSAAAAALPTPAATAETAAVSGDASPAEAVAQAGKGVPATAADNARLESTADVDPALAYGPDDPAYGPPGPDWYKRRDQGAAWLEDAEQHQDEGEASAVRGPFEPLRLGERDASGAAEHRPAGDEPSLDGDDNGPSSLDDEFPDLLDFGTPSDPEAGTLGQIKDLYLTAETISPAGLDRHFDQLLERQRQLISEYFKESGGIMPTEPVLPATSAPDPPDALEARPASAIPHGFDTADSLASLRGDLRSTQ